MAAQQVLDLIGNTPLVEVTRMNAGPCGLFLKMESQNPGGSIKDRIGRSMIEAAESFLLSSAEVSIINVRSLYILVWIFTFKSIV